MKTDKEFGFYSTCLDRLTQLKFLICTNDIEKADYLYNSLYDDTTYNMSRIPLALYVEILLQKIKINILKKSFEENKSLFTNIKSLCFSTDKLSNEFLELRFINNFLLGAFDQCKNIIFYFFLEKNFKTNLSPDIVNKWRYFYICLNFIKKIYKKDV